MSKRYHWRVSYPHRHSNGTRMSSYTNSFGKKIGSIYQIKNGKRITLRGYGGRNKNYNKKTGSYYDYE